MGLFRRRRAVETPARTAGRAFPEDQIAAATFLRETIGPLNLDELPVVVGLAQLHADVIAQLDLQAVDETTGVPLVQQPPIMVQPDPSEDRFDTIHAIVQSLWYTGNAASLIGPARDAIRVLSPTVVAPMPSTDPVDTRRLDGWFLAGQPVDPSAILHIKINDDPRKGPLGRSPLRQCWQAVENYGWAYRYIADYFRSGGNPSLLLKSRNATDDVQAKELADAWILARQERRPAVVPYDVEVLPGPGEQDLGAVLDTLAFCAAEICRGTNTPPSLGNAPTASQLTYSTQIEELRRWLVLSLAPTYLTRIEKGFTRLLPVGQCARFDLSTLPRLDVFGAPGAPPAPEELGTSSDATTNVHNLRMLSA